MDKIVEVDLQSMDDLTEKYNNKVVSRDLINYIIEQAFFIKRKDNIKIIINNSVNMDSKIELLIKDGLNKEYQKTIKRHYFYNIIQLLFLIFGILFLFISTLINEPEVFKEIMLIGGWVLIWEMIDIELFSDSERMRRQSVLKKLLKSEIIENKKNKC